MNPADRQRKKSILRRRIRDSGNHDSHAGHKLKLMENEDSKEQMRKRYEHLGGVIK